MSWKGADLAKNEADRRLLYLDGLRGFLGRDVLGGFKDNTTESREVISCAVPMDVRLEDLETAILLAISSLKGGTQERVLLVLDGLDFFAAAIGASAREFNEFIGVVREVCCGILSASGLDLQLLMTRQHAHQIIVTVSTDFPLLQTPTTPLETNHAALAIGLAHQACVVMALRKLDTGAARDISGIMRITRGALWESEEMVEEKEMLYFVGVDGGVRLLNRGT